MSVKITAAVTDAPLESSREEHMAPSILLTLQKHTSCLHQVKQIEFRNLLTVGISANNFV